ncbi:MULTISPECIES: hypothetical protein [Burkholderia]|uniref:Uncharacterized protein n=1 Tax=Burkholderia pyrrocinia TaxID=60550 RepID=A0A318JKK9_BURPY|nr:MULTISPECIES: hypothetical protein [Burkholderia]PXX40802.1 hypothetical protein NA66_1001412 [Burkholderia pyrrocinia]SFW31036.1 hypothetical protein SAMN03159384_01245 [Burkholderia sp. NFACC33-1]SFX32811.1 hypothetical protein SAMN03159408_00950 [Burkholderia sp. NFPP32]
MSVDNNRITRHLAYCAVALALAALPAHAQAAPATPDAWALAVKETIGTRLIAPTGPGHPQSG